LDSGIFAAVGSLDAVVGRSLIVSRSARMSVDALIQPRGLSRVQAARYVGVSPSLFDAMVKDGRMPNPKRINSRTVWDRFRLDEAFEALPDGGGGNPWDEAAACHPASI